MHMPSLPEQIDLTALGTGERHWSGSVPRTWLTRLGEAVEQLHDASASLTVSVESGRTTLHGEAQARVELTCERCLEPLTTTLAVAFDGAAVEALTATDNAAETSAEIEAPKGRLDVRKLLEDELLLGLPVVPRHANEQCDGGQRHFGPEGEALPRRPSPFAALARLRDEDPSAAD